MRRLALLLAVIALAASLTGCKSSKSTASSPEPSNETSSTTTTAPASTADPAAFATGLAWFFTDNDATTPETLPDGLAACTQAKVNGTDATTIAAVKVNADDDNLADAVGIRVIRGTTGCNRDWLTTLFTQKLDLSSLGVTSADQQACVANGFIDKITALDDTTATGTGGESLKTPVADALASCVPVQQALAALLADPSTGIPASSVTCVATEAAKTITWTMLVTQDPGVKDALVQAATTCKAATGGG